MQKTKIRFSIKRPGKGSRATYAVMADTLHSNGKRSQSKVEDERIEALNLAFKGGRDAYLCDADLKTIITDLKKKWFKHYPRPEVNEDNLSLLGKYWKEEYEHRELVDRSTAFHEMRRAVEAMGKTSLQVASRQDIERALSLKEPKKRRRIRTCIVRLLKFIGRPEVRIKTPKRPDEQVTYLSFEEFRRVVRRLKNPVHKTMALASLGSGVRIGELFALSLSSIGGDMLNVATQIDRKRVRRGPKSRKRIAFIIPGFREYIVEIAELPHGERMAMRGNLFSKIFKAACMEEFPKEKHKHLTWHAIRHCYAVHLLGKGVSLSQVAHSLGDSTDVAERYYSGFVLTPDGIESMKEKFKRT